MKDNDKSPSPTRRIFGLLVAFLLVASFLSLIAVTSEPVQATPPSQENSPILIERGINFERWDLGNGRFAWNSAPQWVFNGSEWVPHIYENRYKTSGYYQVQSGLIGVRIYDYYIEFYTPDMSEVRVYNEQWEVQRFKGNKWEDLGAQSGMPTYRVTKDNFNITITKTFTSWAGILEINYIFQEGSLMKHKVVWTSSIAGDTTFRVLQKWAGIVGNKIRHSGGESSITTTATIDSPFFEFRDASGNMKVLVLQYSMYYDESGSKLTEHCLKPVIIDTHAKGMKADFVFGDWTLARNESLTIDPDTVTLSPPSKDVYILSSSPDSNYGTKTTIVVKSWSSGDARSLVEWDISSLSGATITLAQTNFNCTAKASGRTLQFRRITGNWTETGVTWNDPPAITEDNAVNVSSPAATGWYTVTVTDQVIDALDSGTIYGVRIKDAAEGSSTAYSNSFWAKEHGDVEPELYVEYTKEAPPTPPGEPILLTPENDTHTSDNTPTFTWTGGSDADNHRIEVDDDSDFSSVIDNEVVDIADNSWTKSAPGYALGAYYWRVWAVNAEGENCSENTWEFTIEAPKEWKLIETWTGTVEAITIGTPIIYIITINENADTVNLEWENAKNAATYRIQIDNENTFAFPYDYDNAGLTDNNFTAALKNYRTYWRVRGENGVMVGSWSSVFSFNLELDPSEGKQTYCTPIEDTTGMTMAMLIIAGIIAFGAGVGAGIKRQREEP